MPRLNLNVDVDLVVADTLTPWLEWFQSRSYGNKPFNFDEHPGHYHLSQTMRRFMDGDPQQFWKNENLYASVKPFHNSQKVLEILNNSYDIRFYSDSHPEHRLSKLRWIDNHYPYHCGLNHVIAEEKPLYAGDVWVEDRTDTVESLTQSQPGATIFHMVNDINRKSIVFGAIRVDNWTEIGRHLV